MDSTRRQQVEREQMLPQADVKARIGLQVALVPMSVRKMASAGQQTMEVWAVVDEKRSTAMELTQVWWSMESVVEPFSVQSRLSMLSSIPLAVVFFRVAAAAVRLSRQLGVEAAVVYHRKQAELEVEH